MKTFKIPLKIFEIVITSFPTSFSFLETFPIYPSLLFFQIYELFLSLIVVTYIYMYVYAHMYICKYVYKTLLLSNHHKQ